MANIRIEGYRTILPNEVFGRPSNPIPHQDTELPVKTTEIIYLERYCVPRTDDILQAIVTSAVEIRDKKSDDKYTFSEIAKFLKTGVELNHINLKYIEKIASSEKETIDHLQKHMPLIDLEQERYYLRFFNGIILDDILKTSAPAIKSLGNNNYGKMIELCGYDSLIFTLMMHDSKTLPKRSEVEYLMKRRVKTSDVISITGREIDYQKFVKKIEWIYDIFTPQEIDKIPDTSLSLFGTTASKAILISAKCIKSREYPLGKEGMGSLIETVDDLFEQSKGVDDTGFQRN